MTWLEFSHTGVIPYMVEPIKVDTRDTHIYHNQYILSFYSYNILIVIIYLTLPLFHKAS